MKLTCVESASIPSEGKWINEDDFYFDDSLAFVLDGATGLGEPLIPSTESDAHWFVQEFKSLFTEYFYTDKSIEKCLSYVINRIKISLKGLTSTSIPEKYRIPSAGLALVSLDGHILNIHRMGDCEIYCQLDDKKIWNFPPSKLESLDNYSTMLLQKQLSLGKNFLEARKEIESTLIKHRSMMNTPNGYSALSPDLKCLDYLETKKINVNKVRKILLCSDGFSAAFKSYKICKVDDIFSNRAPSLKNVIRDIRELENKDKSLLKHPRLKPQDDATSILIEVDHSI